MLDWVVTLSSIFGGCCGNAISLEQITAIHQHAGAFLTFLQFLAVSLYGLPQHLTWTSYGPRLRPRTVPLLPYLAQVSLFYLISLLNNAAFAYHIPMSVHIIFRSGGLIVTMCLGWMVGKRYTLTQVASVVLVTMGIVLTTLSASQPASSTRPTDTHLYAKGIAILSVALLLSGVLGLAQDWTYSTYARPPKENGAAAAATPTTKPSATWRESMFYLHFLSLPMFFFVREDILSQLRIIQSSSSNTLTLPLPWSVGDIAIPTIYVPLVVNTLTQLVCVAGVNRLTTRVSALTVTLILAVRKAVSLVLSVVGDGVVIKYAASVTMKEVSWGRHVNVNVRMMWTGATLVMIGTLGYSLGSAKKETPKKKQS